MMPGERGPQMIVGFDESHGERWTISDDLARGISPEDPERRAYSHLALLAATLIGSENVRIRGSLSEQSLAGLDVLVIAEPSSAMTEETARTLLAAVSRGMGVFLILGETPIGGETRSDAGPDTMNAFTGKFGTRVTRHEVTGHHPDAGYLLTHSVTCEAVLAHPVTNGVRRVACHHGISLECRDGSSSAMRTQAGDAPVAVAEHGEGRIVVVGTAEAFAAPLVGREDNAALFINALCWLGKITAGRVPSRREIQLVLGTQTCEAGRPPGNGVPAGGEVRVDVGTSGAALRRLYPSCGDPYARTEQFLQDAQLAFHELPLDLRRRVTEFRRKSNRYGGLVVRGLPGDKGLPPTPADPREAPEKATYMSEFWLAVFASALGEPVAFSQEKSGAIFQNVMPTRGNAKMLSSESSEILLDYHTEAAFHPLMPDYLLLYCLRPDPHREAATLLAGSRALIPRVPLRHRPVLFEREFHTGVDYSFGSPNGLAGNGPVLPVLRGDPFDPLMRLDPDLMVGLNAEAADALGAVKSVIGEAEIPVFLEENDLLIIDNHRAIHGRSAFRAYYDGTDRWLQRVYVLSDLSHVVEDRQANGRVIRTRFAV